jgi:hypothetical protein
MWTALLLMYAAGAVGTAATVFRNRVFTQAYAVNVAASVLWPVYWGFFLTSALLGRTGGGSARR